MARPHDAVFKKPSTLRSRVQDYLRTAIMEGRFKGGEKLREQYLCDRLDISRPTLREALRTLEAERLITIEPHRGPTVVRLTAKDACDLYALRTMLEGFAAHEFARLASDADIERLRFSVQALHAQAAQGERSDLLSAKGDFYNVLLAGCGNNLIKEMLLSLLSRINLLRATSFSSQHRLPQSLVEIDHIFERIKARDAQGARNAAQNHIVNAQQAALEVLRQQQEATESDPYMRTTPGGSSQGAAGQRIPSGGARSAVPRRT